MIGVGDGTAVPLLSTPPHSLCPCPAGCHVTSCHVATSHLPVPLPLIAPLSRLLSGSLLPHLSSRQHRLPSPVSPPLIRPPPFITPLSRLFSGWLLHHLLSCRRLPSTCPLPLIAPPPLTVPLLRLLFGWLLRRLLSWRCLPSACASASQCTDASCCAPLAIVCTMQSRQRSVARSNWWGGSHGHSSYWA